MNVEKIVDVLCTIGNFSKEEAEKYVDLIKINCYPFADREYGEDEEKLLEYFVAAKTNYQISLTLSNGEISSFTAGDVSVSTSSNGNVQSNAKILFENAYADVAHLAEDKGFYFRGV
ncbi:MAG: hypothetical protein Q4C99_02860 [Clostridia bacterium]|nr:hypothetical protein [Clostridia bacterium]